MIWFMVLNATFNNISVIYFFWWREPDGIPRENHDPVVSH